VPQAILMSLSTALLMIGSLSSSVTNRLLTRPGLLYVGMISYSLYLFHFAVPPIAFHGQFQTFNFSAGVYYAANFAFSLALAIMLATGVYRLVEVPGRRILRRAGDRLLGIRRPLPAASGRSAAAE
jgi:peptidoglycan/LPS O-acetylase OafA/YrhL